MWRVTVLVLCVDVAQVWVGGIQTYYQCSYNQQTGCLNLKHIFLGRIRCAENNIDCSQTYSGLWGSLADCYFYNLHCLSQGLSMYVCLCNITNLYSSGTYTHIPEQLTLRPNATVRGRAMGTIVWTVCWDIIPSSGPSLPVFSSLMHSLTHTHTATNIR